MNKFRAGKITKLKKPVQCFAEPENKYVKHTRSNRKLNLRKLKLSFSRRDERRSFDYSHDYVYSLILHQAHALSLPEGWANTVAERVANEVDEWIADKAIVTKKDLEKVIAEKLEKLNPDIAYAFRNNDKII